LDEDAMQTKRKREHIRRLVSSNQYPVSRKRNRKRAYQAPLSAGSITPNPIAIGSELQLVIQHPTSSLFFQQKTSVETEVKPKLTAYEKTDPVK
jgi:hypothetical protein